MNDYNLHTKKTWHQTMEELSAEFSKWNIHQWETNYPRGARLSPIIPQNEQDRSVTLRYKVNGKEVVLTMSRQLRAADNLRVLLLAIHDIRMNEVRGIDEVMKSAYLQLAGPVQKKTPWEVFGVMPGTSLAVCEAVWRTLVKDAHPDRGGSQDRIIELNEAIEELRKGNK